MSEHTPGPWTFVRSGLGFRIDAGKEQVAIADYTDHAVGEADARLISAAPDLLEAAEQAEYWLNEEILDPNAGSTYPDEILRVLRAAIAKAKGE